MLEVKEPCEKMLKKKGYRQAYLQLNTTWWDFPLFVLSRKFWNRSWNARWDRLFEPSSLLEPDAPPPPVSPSR